MLAGVLVGPANVDNDVFPAERLQVLCHVVGVGFDFGFGDGGAVNVPAIPAHGRRGSPLAEVVRSGSDGNARDER